MTVDNENFDRLAQFLGAAGSRRAAVATLLGATLLGHDFDEADSRRRKRRRRKGQPGLDNDDGDGTATCFPGTNCLPGSGRTNAGCDFSGSTVFRNLDAHGSVLSNSNFSGADLSGANLRGAALNGACFVDASLLGAVIDSSTVLGNAIFCNAVMPDGSVNNSGCDKGAACCPTTAPTGSCNALGGFCGIIAGPCCSGSSLECVKPPISTCQSFCTTNQECQGRFAFDVECGEVSACGDRRCCRRQNCRLNGDCPRSGVCCRGICCNSGERCFSRGCVA